MSEAKMDSLEFMETVIDNINSKLVEIIISDETTRKCREVKDAKYNIGEEQREEVKAIGKTLERMLGV